jgi:hypothetical protein
LQPVHLPEDENYQFHHVNCVSALLLCSVCIQEGRWKSENTDNCTVCGMNRQRMQTWTAADCENPLREFLSWMIHGLGRNRLTRTFAIAHYGG